MANLVNMTGKPDVEVLAPAATNRLRFAMLDKSELDAAQKSMGALDDLSKSAMATISAIRRGDQIVQLAFQEDPLNKSFSGIYRQKIGLVPDGVSKALARTDDLVGAILAVRANQLSAFGRELQDRFSTGFRVEPRDGLLQGLDEESRKQLLDRISKAERLISTCGHTTGFDSDRQVSLSRFMYEQGRNAVLFGRFATEILWSRGPDGKKVFHAFRSVDAGTIYFATPREDQQDKTIRARALQALEQYYGQRLVKEKVESDKYAYYQVINSRPVQGFTSDELYVWSIYPCTDIELGGYPVTPVDTAIQAITTHLNIVTHNKLYFQNGRAARGMIMVQSDDVDDSYLEVIRQHFQATATGVEKSWRVPVFGIGTEDKVTWQPMELQGGRDMEFQYLSDQNARVIMSAWQISPEELPGYQHLARGTNNMALSECFDPESLLWTNTGLRSAASLLGEQTEVDGFKVWTGTAWRSARLFRTGKKRLVETQVGAMSIKTSPDHRFRVLGECGELIWKQQRDLKPGDLLAVNAKPVEGDVKLVPEFRGRLLTPEVCEVLGWMVGDGSLVEPRKRSGGVVKLYYHHKHERQIWARHAAILSEFGVNTQMHQRSISEGEAEDLKERYGFTSVAQERISNICYDTEFVRWLNNLGFGYSGSQKTISPLLYVLPVEYRQAFLRGLFSSDGHPPKSGQVALTLQKDVVREQVKQMLLGLGIRTLPCKGIDRCGVGGRSFSHKIFVKDREQFWEQIGFLQPHKAARRKRELWTVGAVPARLAANLLQPVLTTTAYAQWDKGCRDNIRAVVQADKGNAQRSISWGSLKATLEQAFGSAPDWLRDYHFEPVSDLVTHETEIDMVDVEVFDDSHAQILQGFQVHNSNNEYKLEAARDVGIRPILANFQDFLNNRILPLVDPVVAKYCYLKLYGLDADTPEREATRIGTDMPIHMTYDEVLERVEKDPQGRHWGGAFPLNPGFQAVLDKYLTVGEILEHFFGREGAAKDPALQYIRDPFWFNYQQMLMQLQAASAQQQAPPPGSVPPSGGGGDPRREDGRQRSQHPDEPESPVAAGADQALQGLGKSESQMSVNARRILVQHQKTVDGVMSAWQRQAKEILHSARRAHRRKSS